MKRSSRMNKNFQLLFLLVIVLFTNVIRLNGQKSLSYHLDTANCSIHELKTPFTEIWYSYDTLIQGIRALKVRDEIMTKSERLFLFNSERQLQSVVFHRSSEIEITLLFDSLGLRERKEVYPDGAYKTLKYDKSERISEVIEIGKDKIGTRKIYNEMNELVQIVLIINQTEFKPTED